MMHYHLQVAISLRELFAWKQFCLSSPAMQVKLTPFPTAAYLMFEIKSQTICSVAHGCKHCSSDSIYELVTVDILANVYINMSPQESCKM